MTDITFLRHFATRVDPDVPVRDWELSAAGRRAEEEFLDGFDAERFEAVYSSPEAKALHTAERIADRGPDLVVSEALHEVDRSGEGFVNDEAAYRAMVADWLEGEAAFDWEATDAVRERVRAFAGAVADAEGPVVAVVHGIWLAMVQARVTGDDPFELWSDLGFGDTWTVAADELRAAVEV